MILYTKKHRMPIQIDESDWEAVSMYSWAIGVRGYPVTRIGKRENTRVIPLHVFLMGRAPRGLGWDHHDRDKLNNQRGNLRAVSATVNIRNTGKSATNKSGVKGVHWSRASNRWTVQIRVPGRTRHIGLFDSIEAATAARLAAEDRLWGSNR